MIRTLLSRLLTTLLPARHERRLQEEIEAHLEELAAHEQAHGVSAGEAERNARRAFGPIEPAKEQFRDQARFRWLENTLRDVRFALRQYRKSPGFTAAAVVSLALGIGANAALFSFVNALLLKHLPVPDAERLVLVKSTRGSYPLSYNQVNELDRQATEIEGLLGSWRLMSASPWQTNPEWVSAELATGDYFRTLQIKPERGRLLSQHDLDEAAGNPVCVISDRLWRSKLNGGEDVVGRTIRINMRTYKIIGITERTLRGTSLQRPSYIEIPVTRLPDLMPAFASNPGFDWKSRLWLLGGMARLKPHATLVSAQAQLSRLSRTYLETLSKTESLELRLTHAEEGLWSESKLARPASILLAVSLVVLLIACANLSSLLLSRNSARSTEFALRLGIGASRKRIFSQVLIESALLAFFGGLASLFVAYALDRSLLIFLNRTAPAIHQLHIALDSRVPVFMALTALFCVVLSGAVPALDAARNALLGSSAGNTRPGAGIRKAFVVMPIALAFVVVLAAGLLTETLRHLKTLDLGYQPDEIAVIDIRPASGGYTGVVADQFYGRMLERLRALPGVKSASAALCIGLDESFTVKLDSPERTGIQRACTFAVGSGYFQTFGARIIAGRDFDQRDTRSKPQVFIISQHLAENYFHGQNPVGRYLRSNGENLPVIGVVSDIRDQSVRDLNPDTIYGDADQLMNSSLTLFVRCAGRCQPLLPSLRKALHELDANTPILAMHTMQTEIEGSISSSEVLGVLSTIFAVLAMLLVATGLYGVLSYALTRRTREVGLRVAVGALPKDIAALFASEALRILLLGTATGIPAALAAVNLLRAQLFGVAPYDPVTLVLCFGCIAATVVAASIAPIRRALRIAPQQALRID